RPLSTVPGHIRSIRHTIGVILGISARGSSRPGSHLVPAGPSDVGRRAETGGAVESIGTTTTSTSIGRGVTRSGATIGSTGRNTDRASDTTTTTCARSSATTICATVLRIGWISAARVASKSSGPAAIDRARHKGPAQGKGPVNGQVRDSGLRVDGLARDIGRLADAPAPNGLQVESVLRSGLRAGGGPATR